MDKYFDEVFVGLAHTHVTCDGIELSYEAGVRCWVEKAREVQENCGQLFFCGNGASCTMAEHMSHDWFQNAEVNTYTCSETAHLTAIANDLAYSEIFAYRIGRVMTEEDLLITISSSGNSENILRAIEVAKRNGAFVVTLSGMDENNRSMASGDLNFYVPLDTYGLVESAHAVLLHNVLDVFLDRYRGGRH